MWGSREMWTWLGMIPLECADKKKETCVAPIKRSQASCFSRFTSQVQWCYIDYIDRLFRGRTHVAVGLGIDERDLTSLI